MRDRVIFNKESSGTPKSEQCPWKAASKILAGKHVRDDDYVIFRLVSVWETVKMRLIACEMEKGPIKCAGHIWP